MGAAFDDIMRGNGYAYFPAVSLSYGEVIQMNFGATPFRFSLHLMFLFNSYVFVFQRHVSQPCEFRSTFLDFYIDKSVVG